LIARFVGEYVMLKFSGQGSIREGVDVGMVVYYVSERIKYVMQVEGSHQREV